MKKLSFLVALFAVASTATADISVNFQQSSGNLANNEFTALLTTGTYVGLYWSATDAAADTTLNTSGESSNDILLSSTTSTGGGGIFDLGSIVADDPDVSNVDINNGYLFVRFFDTATVNGGFYYQHNIDDDGTLTEFTVGGFPQSGNTYNGGTSTAFVGSVTAVNTAYVIPEPATIGLMGIAGAGLFAARRKKHA